jgi:hypothetical protein
MLLLCQCVYFLCLKSFCHVYYLNPSLHKILVYPNVRHEIFFFSNLPVVYFSKRHLVSDQTLHALVFYDMLQHRFGPPDRPSSVRYQIHKKDIKGEKPLCTVVQIITILLQKQNNKVKVNA